MYRIFTHLLLYTGGAGTLLLLLRIAKTVQRNNRSNGFAKRFMTEGTMLATLSLLDKEIPNVSCSSKAILDDQK